MSEIRKRFAVESSSLMDSHSIKRERRERERDRERERKTEKEEERERERERDREEEVAKEKKRARFNNSFYKWHKEADRSKGSQAAKTNSRLERARFNNSFYKWQKEADRSKGSQADKINSRLERDLSDVSLSDVSPSDEESYLREKASNSFYDDKEEPKLKASVDPKQELKRHARETNARRRRDSRSRSRSRDLGIDKKPLLKIARKNVIRMFKRGKENKISKGHDLSDLSSEDDSDVDKNGNSKPFHYHSQLKERESIVIHIRNSTPIVPATASLREEQTKAITMFPVSSGQTHRMNEVWVPVESKDKVVPLPALPPAKQATNMFKETPKNVFAKPLPQQDQQEPAFKPVGVVVPIPPSTAATAASPAPAAPKPVPPPVIMPKETAPFVPEVPIPSAKVETTAPSASIFPEVAPPSMDVSSIITQRLSAIRRLQDNPGDSEALKMMYHAQRNMSSWANSKHLPGQFTGSTGAQVMKAHELNSGPQLWVRKDQLTSTKPVTGGMGMALLQKMGWKPGEGLGRFKTGSLQPLLLDVKLDKRGLGSRNHIWEPQVRQNAPQRKNKPPSWYFGGGNGPLGATPPAVAPVVARDKHPVSVLNILASKNKWALPQYTLCQDTGTLHSRSYIFSVEINGQSYTPELGCPRKKKAKRIAAQLCLRELGILPPS